MKTELNNNEKLSTEKEAPPIANVLLAAVNCKVLEALKSKHKAWIGNQTDQITSANAKGFKDGIAWAISTIEHFIEQEHFEEEYSREEAEMIALQNRYVYDDGGNCDGFAR